MGLAGLAAFSFLLFTLRGKSFQARAFPTALLVLLLFLCLVLIVRKDRGGVYDFSSLLQVLLYGGLLLVYVVLMPYIGFILSTAAFLSAFLILQKYPMKKYWIVLFSLATAAALWLLFAKGFGVRLPEILF